MITNRSSEVRRIHDAMDTFTFNQTPNGGGEVGGVYDSQCDGRKGFVGLVSTAMCEKPHISLSLGSNGVSKICSATAWRKAGLREKPKLVRVDRKARLPYLVRVHKRYCDEQCSVSPESFVSPVCTVEQLEKAFENMPDNASISVADACYLAQFGIYMPEHVRIVGVYYKNDQRSVDANIQPLLTTLSRNIRTLPSGVRNKFIDAVTKLHVESQIAVSQEWLNTLPVDLQRDIDSYNKCTAQVEMSADADAVPCMSGRVQSLETVVYVSLSLLVGYLFRMYTADKSSGIYDMAVRVLRPVINQIQVGVRECVSDTISNGVMCVVVAGILFSAILTVANRPAYAVCCTFILVSVLTVVFAQPVKSALRNALLINTCNYWYSATDKGESCAGLATELDVPIMRGRVQDAELAAMPWLAQLMVTLGVVVCGVANPSSAIKGLAGRLRNVTFATNGAMKLASVLQTGFEMIKLVGEELLTGGNPMLALHLKGSPGRMMREFEEMIKDSEFCDVNYVARTMELATNADYRKKFIVAYDEAIELARVINSDQAYMKNAAFSKFVTRVDRFLKYYRAAKVIEGLPRTVLTPFAVSYWGKPGIGKSSIAPAIAGTIFGPNSYIYARSAGDPYWSGYNSAYSTVLYDDWGAMKSDTSANDDTADFFRIATNNPVRLNMPSVEDDATCGVKGTIFNSPLVLLMTNRSVPTSAYLVNDVEALLRRRHLCYAVSVRKEYAKYYQNGAMRYDQLGKDGYQKALKFSLYDPLCRTEPGAADYLAEHTYDEMLAYVSSSFENHIMREVQRAESTVEVAKVLDMPAFTTTDWTTLRGRVQSEDVEVPPQTSSVGVNTDTTSMSSCPDFENTVVERWTAMRDVDNERQTYAGRLWDWITNPGHNADSNRRVAHSVFKNLSSVGPSNDTQVYKWLLVCAMRAGHVDPITCKVVMPCLCSQNGRDHAMTMQCYPDVERLRENVQLRESSLGGRWSLAILTRPIAAIRSALPSNRWTGVRVGNVSDTNSVAYSATELVVNALTVMGFVTVIARVGETFVDIAKGVVARVMPGHGTAVMTGAPQFASGAPEFRGVRAPPPSQFAVSRVQSAHDNVVDVVHDNVVNVVVSDIAGTTTVHGVFLKGRCLAIPRHAIEGKLKSALITIRGLKLFCVPYRGNGQEETYQFDIGACKVVHSTCVVGRESHDADIVIIECPVAVRLFNDVTNHFALERELKVAARGVMLKYVKGERVRDAFDLYRQGPACNVSGKHKIYVSDSYCYDTLTDDGDCGAPIVAQYVTGHNRVYGWHVVGGEGVGHAMVVTQELVKAMLDEIHAVVDTRAIDVADDGFTRIEGHFQHVGFAEEQFPEIGSVLRPSAFEVLADTTNREPSILKRKDARYIEAMKRDQTLMSTPLAQAVTKYGQVCSQALPYAYLSMATAEYGVMLVSKFVRSSSDVLSVEEAMNSREGLSAMALDTSPGLPYIKEGLTRKNLITLDHVTGRRTPSKRLLQDVRHLEREFGKGNTSTVVWRDFLKDELRPAAKIAAGKTRHITCSPVSFVVLTRMYFGDFESMFHTCGWKQCTALGMCPESRQWDAMIHYLKSCGDRGYALDYKNFDGAIPAEIIASVMQVVEKFYANATPHDRMVRKVIMEHIVHTLCLCDDLYYIKHKGNPSGCPVTSILNTVANWIILRTACLATHDNISGSLYQTAGMVAYGDDTLFVPSRSMLTKGFDIKRIVDWLVPYGITITDECNAGFALQDIETLPFLKRNSVWREDLHAVVPVMDWNTIQDILNWTRQKSELDDPLVLESRLNAVLCFYWFYGARIFTAKREHILNFLRGKGLLALVRLFESEAIHEMYEANSLGQHTGVMTFRGDFVSDMKGEVQGNSTSNVYNNLLGTGSIDARNAATASGASLDLRPAVRVDMRSGLNLDSQTVSGGLLGGVRPYSQYNSNADIPTMCEMMSLMQNNFTVVKHEHFSTPDDDMMVGNILRRFHRIKTVAWSQEDPVNHRLADGYLCPWQQATSVRDDVTPLEYVSLLNGFWSGDLVYRFEGVVTAQHAGMLFFGTHFGAYDLKDIETQPIEIVTGQYGSYIDVHDQHDFSYTVDFKCSTPALNAFRTFADRVVDSLGVWTLDVVNPLAVQGLVATTVDVNIYVAAGTNFQIHYPRPARNILMRRGEEWLPAGKPTPPPSGLGFEVFVGSWTPDEGGFGPSWSNDMLASYATLYGGIELLESTAKPIVAGQPYTETLRHTRRGVYEADPYWHVFCGVVGNDIHTTSIAQVLTSEDLATWNPVPAANLYTKTSDTAAFGYTAFIFTVQLKTTVNYFRIEQTVNTASPISVNALELVSLGDLTGKSLVQLDFGAGSRDATDEDSRVVDPRPTSNGAVTAHSVDFSYQVGAKLDEDTIIVGNLQGAYLTTAVVSGLSTPFMDQTIAVTIGDHTQRVRVTGPVEAEHNRGSMVVAEAQVNDGAIHSVNGTGDAFIMFDLIVSTVSSMKGHVQSNDESQVDSEHVQVEESDTVAVTTVHPGTTDVTTCSLDQFGESLSDFRMLLRRFDQVMHLEGTIGAGGDVGINLSLSHMMTLHPWYGFLAGMYRFQRGCVRMRFNLVSSSVPLLAVKIRVDAYSDYADEDTAAMDGVGLATKYLSTQTPSATLEIPFLSSLHCNYTPFSVPQFGSAMEPNVNVQVRGSEGDKYRIDVLLALGDNFRMSEFIGVGTVDFTPGAPNYILDAAMMRGRVQSKVAAGGVVVENAEAAVESSNLIKSNASLAMRHMMEQNWTIAETLERPGFVANFPWTVSDAQDKILMRRQVPLDFMVNDIARVAVTNFRFFRFSAMEVRITVNSTQMHCGRLVAYYRPGVTASGATEKYSSTNSTVSLRNHVMLDPARNPTGILTVPFNHPLGYLHVGAGTLVVNEDFKHFLGYVDVAVFNPLRIASGRQSVNVNVVVVFKDPEAKVIRVQTP